MDLKVVSAVCFIVSIAIFVYIFVAFRKEGRTPRYYRKSAILFGVLTLINIAEAFARGGADIMLIMCTMITSVAAAVNWRIYKKGE